MSSTIEYRHVAVKLDISKAHEYFASLMEGEDRLFASGLYPHHQFAYFWLVERGESNVTQINYDTGREVADKNYWLDQVGYFQDVLQSSFKTLSAVEGGCLKVGGRYKNTTAESYIALYRRELNRALQVRNFTQPHGETWMLDDVFMFVSGLTFAVRDKAKLMSHPYSKVIEAEIDAGQLHFCSDSYIYKTAWMCWAIDQCPEAVAGGFYSRVMKQTFDDLKARSVAATRQSRYQAKKQSIAAL